MKTKTATITFATLLLFTAVAAQTHAGSSSNVEATLINTDPVPLQSGESGDLTFKLVNSGNTEAKDVQVELLDNYPFQVKPDRKKVYSLGEMVQTQEYQISTEVMVADDAPDGSNNFKIRVIHGELNKTVNVPVEVQSDDIELNIANLKTQPKQLMPDTDNNLMTVEVVNNGEKTSENTVLDLEMPNYFEQTSSFSTRQALGNIQPGQVKTAEFNFDMSEEAEAGLTEIKATLTYSPGDSTSEVTQEINFDVDVEGRPWFEIIDSESQLKTGSTRELRLEVKNKGDEKSSSTRIRVLDSSDQPFSYDSSSQYVGTLEPGQTGTAVFEVETESDAPAKEYLLDFEIRGVKGTEVFVEDTTVEASVSQGQQSSSSTIYLLIAGVLLVLVGGVYYFRDRLRDL
jgi:hypothetical protein